MLARVVFSLGLILVVVGEPSIANMYFEPYTMPVADFDPDFVAARGLGPQAQPLTWVAFSAGTCCRSRSATSSEARSW
ncbi:MAG: hypothetical protein ACREKG_01530 [Candidatus Rokuibacteriota bacterium]